MQVPKREVTSFFCKMKFKFYSPFLQMSTNDKNLTKGRKRVKKSESLFPLSFWIFFVQKKEQNYCVLNFKTNFYFLLLDGDVLIVLKVKPEKDDKSSFFFWEIQFKILMPEWCKQMMAVFLFHRFFPPIKSSKSDK
jgi:hypothetical protein